MSGPMMPQQVPSCTLKLYRDATLAPDYKLRQSPFGYYLINRSRHVAVTKQALPVLVALNSPITLGQIEDGLVCISPEIS